MITLTCETCRKPFQRNPGELKRPGRGRFCSKPCMYASKGSSVTLPCSICGKAFTRKASQVEKYKNPCCSRSCTRALKQRLYQGDRNPNYSGGLITVPCSACGAALQREPNQLRRRTHAFCNDVCRTTWTASHFSGTNSARWRGGYKEYYGPNWYAQARAARKRDGYQCQCCGKQQNRHRALDVHHLTPFRTFGYIPNENTAYQQANQLDNLVSVCQACHGLLENNLIALPIAAASQT